MTLTPGAKLGHYEVVGPLGAGGMGEVYRARDARLGRDVAIKVLPPSLSGNAEVRARFEREARTVSSLNHPHICTLHDVGREGDTDFLVLELIDGETLAQRLTRGPLPTVDVLRIGAQIADALDRAHRAGVTHRDLKPGNVMLTRSGAKLMDFGLARATGLAGPGQSGVMISGMSQSPTMGAPLTAEGTIIGTFQYMAPEQLEGREADARADIWALGCVLYEMATGRRAFDGSSQASLISAIMKDTPRPIGELAPATPAALDRLVRQCTAKDPDERLQSAHDIKLQLAGLAEGGSTFGAAAVAARPARPAWTALIPWAVAALAVIAAIVTLMRSATNEQRALRTVIAAPPGTRMNLAGDEAGTPVLSPDGTTLVFAAIGQGAGSRLWLRRMDELTARPLPGTDEGQFPFWSPDGRSIGFFTNTQLKRLDLDGGSVVTLAPTSGARGGTWSKRGVILYTSSYTTPLSRVAASGGKPAAVTTLDSTFESTHRWPQFMPDGEHFIYLSASHNDPTASGIWYASLSGGKPKKVISSPNSAVYASGWLLFVRDSTLMAQRFDPGSGRTSGEPITTSEVVQFDPSTWRTVLTTSENGLMVHGLGGRTMPFQVTWFDRAGHALRELGEPANHIQLALSPDGSHLAVETQYQPNADLWLTDVASGTRRRITSTPGDESGPVWSPDGTHIAYGGQSIRAGAADNSYRIEMIRSDGVGKPVTLLADSTLDVAPISWSMDGRYLLIGRGDYSSVLTATLHRLTIADGKVEPVVPESQTISTASFSPDGRWIAFATTSSGRSEVVVVEAPRAGEPPDVTARQYPITGNGGNKPVWRRDSRELYYMRPDGTLMALAVDGSGGEFRVLSETPLFQAFQRDFVHSMDVTADGQHFAIVVAGTEGGAPLAVVTDWTRMLKGR